MTFNIFLSFFLFFTISEKVIAEHKNYFYCYDSMLPFERSEGGSINVTCPEGLNFYNSVQLCCTNNQEYKPMIDEKDKVFYQQHYVSIPVPDSPDAIPNGCIRAVHLPNESVPFCGPSYKKNKNSIRNRKLRIYTKFMSIPVSNGTQNNFCCSPRATIAPKKQSVYHGTVAGQLNRHGDQETVTIRNTCIEGPIRLDMIENGYNEEPIHGIYDYNRLCYIPNYDKDLTAPGDYREEIKIRISFDLKVVEHVNIAVGNYEYDYTKSGARRRIFSQWLDDKTPEDSPKKAKSFTKRLVVSSKKADQTEKTIISVNQITSKQREFRSKNRGENSLVFWYMATETFLSMPPDPYFGWDNAYDRLGHNCVDFVFNFVCLLNDGKCPEKELWPENFALIDRELNHGIYTNEQAKSKREYNMPTLTTSLSEYATLIQVDKKATPSNALPPVVEYTTGEYDNFDTVDPRLIKTIRVEQKAYAQSANDGNSAVVYKAQLKAHFRDWLNEFKILEANASKALKQDFSFDDDGFLRTNVFDGNPIII